MMRIGRIAAILLLSVCKCADFHDSTPADAFLNFTSLAVKYGHGVKEYDVVTEDGYILKVFNIPGDRKRPVLLLHGIVDSADTFIIRGERSLAISLANEGYDVWAGNCRGNRYSRRHITLDPDVDKKFWDFSYHDTGFYDLPAMVDFVLMKTGRSSLSAIGHSQGNTVFYVLASTRPEYNSKVNVLIAISPVCFLNSLKPAAKSILNATPTITRVLRSFGQEEIFRDNSAISTLTKVICGQKVLGYEICARGVFFMVGGSDPDEVEPDFFPVVAAHYPTGTSLKNAVHVSQNAASKTFAQFDYGPLRNEEVYRSAQPPKYNLAEVKMRVAMLFGGNDGISSLKDVSLLCRSLPNVVEYRMIEHRNFNHLDAVWGRNMKIYLFPHIFEILIKYLNK